MWFLLSFNIQAFLPFLSLTMYDLLNIGLMQLGFLWRTFYILVAQISLLKFTTKNMQMPVFVELTNGENLLRSFWGSPILSCGIIVTSSLMRSWEAWKMYMLLVLVISICLSRWFSYVLFPLKHMVLCSHAPLCQNSEIWNCHPTWINLLDISTFPSSI